MMKKIFCFILISVAINVLGLAQNDKKYIISGEMTRDSLRFTRQSIKDLYLCRLIDGKYVAIDSTKVVGKKFKFEGLVHDVDEIVFITGFDNGFVQVYLEPGIINISPFDGYFPIAAKPSGTPNNEVLRGFLDLERQSSMLACYRLESMSKNLPDSITSNQDAFMPFHRSVYFSNSLIYKTMVMDYVTKHMNSPVSLYIIKAELWPMFTPKVLERQFMRAVPKSLREYPLYSELMNLIKAANMKIGAPAPDIAGKTPEGKVLNLSDLKGKYVLLDFWASWCGPCRREFPYLKKALEASEKTDKFILLSYSIDSKESDWLKAIDNNELKHKNWIHISTLKGWSSDAVKLFNMNAVPYTVLLNPDGAVVAFDLRGDEMLKKVKSVIGGFDN